MPLNKSRKVRRCIASLNLSPTRRAFIARDHIFARPIILIRVNRIASTKDRATSAAPIVRVAIDRMLIIVPASETPIAITFDQSLPLSGKPPKKFEPAIFHGHT